MAQENIKGREVVVDGEKRMRDEEEHGATSWIKHTLVVLDTERNRQYGHKKEETEREH